MTPEIPKVLHQTWKNASPPPWLAQLRESWLRNHPGWRHRLWTDEDLRRFIAEQTPGFLAAYDAYPEPICRVDAARYVILHRLGGLFVDLDFECLRPADPLLAGHGFVIGAEPALHRAGTEHLGLPDGPILCPSFMAAVPGHPFLSDVLRAIPAARRAEGPLGKTGPFFLSRVHERYRDAAPVSLVAPDLLYPVDKYDCWRGRLFDLDYWDAATRDAYAIHHWDGSWFREDAAGSEPPPGAVSAQIEIGGGSAGPLGYVAMRYDLSETFPDPPLVTAILPASSTRDEVMRAVACWRAQTWPNRELLVVAGSDAARWRQRLAGLGDSRIRVLDVRDEDGALSAASGEIVCRWSPAELHDPLRIAVQMELGRQTRSDAVLLARRTLWWPAEAILAVSPTATLPSTLLCRRDMLAGGVLRKAGRRVAYGDSARLVVLPLPPGARYERPEWRERATPRFEGARYEALMATLRRRLPLDAQPMGGP